MHTLAALARWTPSVRGAWLLLLWVGSALSVHAHAAPSQPTLDPAQALTQYVLDVWTVEDGLPQNSVASIEQTRDGYLWLGTQEGLVRFDGLHFTTYTQEIPNPFVSALHEDAEGTLWIGTYGGGLARYADGQFSTPSLDGLPDGHISALTSDAEGALWIGTFDGGLARLKDDTFRSLSATDGAPESGITTLATGADGTVWVGTLGEGLFRFRDGTFTAYSTADGLAHNEIRSLYPTPDGTLWVSTRLGVSRIVGNRLAAAPAALSGTEPRSILADTEGSLWVGTQQQGLFRLRDGQVEQMTAADGLPHDAVPVLYADREGSLWVGTDGGLARLHGSRLTSYSTPEGLPHSVVFSVYEDAEGAVWMGTEGGGLAHLKNGRITALTTDDGLPSDVVISVRGTQDGSLWAGTHGGGLVRLHGAPGSAPDERRITTYTEEDGVPAPSVFALYEDAERTLWLGTSNGLGRYRDGGFSTLTTADGLSNDLITVLAEDARGRLWVGTYEGGLNVLDGDEVVAQVSTEDGLPSDLILSLYTDSDGALWAGTQDGLSRIVDTGDGFEVHTFTAVQGLPSGTVLQLFEDASGWLWMSSNRGLFRVHADDFDAVAAGERDAVTATLYERTDGLRSQEFNGGVQPAGWQGRDGRLWFPTTDRVVAVDPEHLPGYPTATAHIEALLAQGEAVPLDPAGTDGLSLAAGRRRLTFQYAAPSFLAPDRIRYRYRLDGVDEGWVEAGTRREAFYTNLAPGAYAFHVQALNADGVPGPTATLALDLPPYFYETAWFTVLCVLIGVGLLLLVYAGRVRLLKTRQRELEALVEARTEDLRRTNERLADTSEMKSQLMHVVAHDLKNPLNGVHGLARVLGDELDNDSQQELARLIEEAADEMLKMVIRFLDVEALDSEGNVLLDVEPLDLSIMAHESVERFRLAAIRKEQDLSFAPVPPGDFTIAGDPAWLKEVFDNLVSNAVKYTPPGRAIEVRVERREEGEHGFIRFAIEDEGPGLTTDDMDKLFGRFRRLSAQPTGDESSTGLGLSIVKGIVERHGGRVWAESEPGAGSTFFVEFAALPMEPLSVTATPVVPAPAEAALTEDDWLLSDGLVLDSGFAPGSPDAPPPAPSGDVPDAAITFLD